MNRIMGSAAIVAVTCGMLTPISNSAQEAGDRLRVTFGANWVVAESIRMSPSELIRAAMYWMSSGHDIM